MTDPTPHLVPEALIAAFRRDGYVLTPDVLGEAELDAYGPRVDAEVARRTAGDERSLGEKTTYEQSFIQCMRMWETNAAIRPLTFLPKLASMAAQLLGVETVRLWQDQALYKEPGGRETTPHQDLPFWPIGDAPIVTAWIPFDAVTRAGGGMAYVPGSHRAGRLRVVDITHRSEPYAILDDPALGEAEPVWVDVPRGGVVWHHGMTVHLAAPNTGSTVRRVFTVVYIADGCRRVKPWPAFPLDRAGVGVGDLVAGPGLPVVWPPPVRLPEPPEERGVPTGPQLGRPDSGP